MMGDEEYITSIISPKTFVPSSTLLLHPIREITEELELIFPTTFRELKPMISTCGCFG